MKTLNDDDDSVDKEEADKTRETAFLLRQVDLRAAPQSGGGALAGDNVHSRLPSEDITWGSWPGAWFQMSNGGERSKHGEDVVGWAKTGGEGGWREAGYKIYSIPVVRRAYSVVLCLGRWTDKLHTT